jgi:hypothetical protein
MRAIILFLLLALLGNLAIAGKTDLSPRAEDTAPAEDWKMSATGENVVPAVPEEKVSREVQGPAATANE